MIERRVNRQGKLTELSLKCACHSANFSYWKVAESRISAKTEKWSFFLWIRPAFSNNVCSPSPFQLINGSTNHTKQKRQSSTFHGKVHSKKGWRRLIPYHKWNSMLWYITLMDSVINRWRLSRTLTRLTPLLQWRGHAMKKIPIIEVRIESQRP